MELKKLTEKEFDNLRAVLTCLRHDCKGVKLKSAIAIVSKKLDLSEDEVKMYINRIFGNKNDN